MNAAKEGGARNRRRLLVVNFFPAFSPPSSGGEQRYFHIYDRLSKHFDVTLVSASYADRPEELVEHSTYFREYRVPKHPDSDRVHWSLEGQGIGPECSGYVVALVGAFGGSLQDRIAALAPSMDAIIHDCPFTVPYDLGIGRDGVPRFYNSYNVESDLASKMLKGQAGAKAAAFIAELEQYLVSNSVLVLATSQEERSAFISRYDADPGSTHVVPNGFDECQFELGTANASRASGSIVFMGSHHPPNVEALEYIINELADYFPEHRIQVLGSVCKAYAGPVPPNVDLLGFVSPERKSELLASCRVAINPMTSGAGTNLKMLDYLAHGAPVVTTEVGARGLELENGVHVRVSELAGFAMALKSLLSSPEQALSLGNAGRQFANKHFSWSAIGAHMATLVQDTLDGMASRRIGRKRLLSVCDYPIARPTGGGQVRINSLLTELAREFDVTYLCFSDDGTERREMLAPGLIQRSVPKTQDHMREQKATSEGQWVSVSDVVSSRHCSLNTRMVEVFQEEQALADCVMFEQCFMAPLADHLQSTKVVIYSSQNVEMELKRALYSKRSDGGSLITEVQDIETRLIRRADLVVCVSDEDEQRFLSLEPTIRTLVVGNGVTLAPRHLRSLDGNDRAFDRPMAVFLGSGHPPNVAAAKFIAEDLAEKVPQVIFALVGSVCDALDPAHLPANVVLMGFLSVMEKAALLELADFAVNPMMEGGGSSLKVADYFAAGLPVVSSRVGVRGFRVQDNVHFIAAEVDEFAEVVARFATASQELARMGHEARYFAETNLCWEILAGGLRKAVRRMTSERSARNRLLVTTYRFGQPARGGAELFMQKVLEHLHASGRWDVTVAAPAVGAIHNHLHFSAIYEPPGEADHLPVMLQAKTFLFPVDDADEDALAQSSLLHGLWARESLELGRVLAAKLPGGSLLGGWNFAENARDGVVRWATLCAQIKLPASAGTIQFDLVSPEVQTVGFSRGDEILHAQDISGECSVRFAFGGGGGILTLNFTEAHRVPGEPREISALVKRVRIESNGTGLTCDLSRGIEQIPAEISLEEWVCALVDIATRRDPFEDQRFLATRGPRCSGLEAWLADHASQFDVILAQGVPFATSCMGVAAGRRAGVPVVVLPHFHPEDRYYHWRAFYDAFRQADSVVAAPSATKDLVLARVGARGCVLPGGGVTVTDFTASRLDEGRRSFGRAHKSNKPFALILGRKAAGKNYRKIIDAMSAKSGLAGEIDLVIVGPDEDGLAINEPGVHYLGTQPRDVVVGALASATCLVTMSDSESFGIVLLEAWLAGTPVVANGRCASFAELIDHGVNGFLVQTEQELQGAVRRYASDKSLAAAHAAAGRRFAAGFDWSVLADSLSGVLQDAAVGRHDKPI